MASRRADRAGTTEPSLARLAGPPPATHRPGAMLRTSSRRVLRAAASAAAAALLLSGAPALGAPPREAPPPAPPLRVCADPNNLPYSNERGEGLENRLAELVAGELGRPLAYVWRAQRRGFFREGLGAGTCDVVMGAPAGLELALTTRPYYRSTYVFVARKGGADVSSFDDPRLAGLTVGVHVPGDAEAATPPSIALVRAGHARNLRGYALLGDYREPNPPVRLMDALAAGEIDLAVAWGPLAGWYARRSPVALELRPVAEQAAGGLPMTFAMAAAVKRGNRALRDQIDGALERRRDEVERILDAYGVPRVPAR